MAAKTIRRHGRCKRCKELVLDPDNCANCAHLNPLSISRRNLVVSVEERSQTLDQQESGD